MTRTALWIIGILLVAGVAWVLTDRLRNPAAEPSIQTTETGSASSVAKTYSNATYAFSLQYPATWRYQEIDKSGEPGRSGLLSLVVFTPDGQLSDQSVTVAIGLPKDSAALGARPTTVGSQTAVVYEDETGNQTYLVTTDQYRYSLMMGSAEAAEVKAAFDLLIETFALK